MRHYESLHAAELWCPTCRRATPARERLLLVLPTGNKYEYRCGVCGTSVGEKTDSEAEDFRLGAPPPAPRRPR
jgi:hypothetical protein